MLCVRAGHKPTSESYSRPMNSGFECKAASRVTYRYINEGISGLKCATRGERPCASFSRLYFCLPRFPCRVIQTTIANVETTKTTLIPFDLLFSFLCFLFFLIESTMVHVQDWMLSLADFVTFVLFSFFFLTRRFVTHCKPAFTYVRLLKVVTRLLVIFHVPKQTANGNNNKLDCEGVLLWFKFYALLNRTKVY